MKPHPHWMTRARIAHDRLTEDDEDDTEDADDD